MKKSWMKSLVGFALVMCAGLSYADVVYSWSGQNSAELTNEIDLTKYEKIAVKIVFKQLGDYDRIANNADAIRISSTEADTSNGFGIKYKKGGGWGTYFFAGSNTSAYMATVGNVNDLTFNFTCMLSDDGTSFTENPTITWSGSLNGNTASGSLTPSFGLPASIGTSTLGYVTVNASMPALVTITITATERSEQYTRTIETAELTWSSENAWKSGSSSYAVPPAGADAKLIVNTDSTLTLDSDVSVNKLIVEGTEVLTFAGDNSLTVASTTINADSDVSGITASLGAVSISDEKTLSAGENTTASALSGGALLFDATNASITPDDAMKAAIRNYNGIVTLKGAEENVTTLDFGYEATQSFPARLVVDEGTHNLTYGSSTGDGRVQFAAGLGDDQPTIHVKAGAVLNFSMKDLSGWNGEVFSNPAVIRVENGARLNWKNSNGTGFFKDRLVFDNGAVVENIDNNFILHGGATENSALAQIVMLDSESAAAAEFKGQINLRNYNGGQAGVRGASVFVGTNNVLAFSGSVKGNADDTLRKLGEGTLAIKTVESAPKILVDNGMVEVEFNASEASFASTVEISEGAVFLAEKGSSVDTVTVAMTGGVSGSGLLRTADGVNLSLGTGRPKLDTLGGKLSLQPTPEELIEGEISISTTQESYPVDTFSVVDYAGETIESTVTVSDGVVKFTFASNAYTENTRTSDWSEDLAGVVSIKNGNVDAALTLNVNAVFPAGVTELIVLGKVLIDVSELENWGASVVLNIPEGAEVTVRGAWPFAGVKGAGDLVLDFEGKTATILGDNSEFTGACTIAAGTVKMGHNKCFGPWGQGRAILVKSGAVLDLNGQKTAGGGNTYGYYYEVNLESGAKYSNSASYDVSGMYACPFSKIELLGDAVIEAGEGLLCGMSRYWNLPTTVVLAEEKTLTATGGGEIYFSNPTFSGNGSFKITACTTVTISQYYSKSEYAPVFNAGRIEVDSGSALNLDGMFGGPVFTVTSLIANGILKHASGEAWNGGSSDFTGKYKVTQSLSGSGTINAPMTLGANAVIKPNGVGCPTFSVAPTSERDGGQIAVDTTGIDLNVATRIKILRVTDASLLPSLDLFTGVPRGWMIEKTADGLGVNFVKQQFYIIIR